MDDFLETDFLIPATAGIGASSAWGAEDVLANMFFPTAIGAAAFSAGVGNPKYEGFDHLNEMNFSNFNLGDSWKDFNLEGLDPSKWNYNFKDLKLGDSWKGIDINKVSFPKSWIGDIPPDMNNSKAVVNYVPKVMKRNRIGPKARMYFNKFTQMRKYRKNKYRQGY